jgi:hypothetical protein
MRCRLLWLLDVLQWLEATPAIDPASLFDTSRLSALASRALQIPAAPKHERTARYF